MSGGLVETESGWMGSAAGENEHKDQVEASQVGSLHINDRKSCSEGCAT